MDAKDAGLQLRKELARVAHKIAEDRLTVAASGNISAKRGSRIYIKAKGISFEKARPSDFVRLNIEHPAAERLRPKPSFEYRFHIACYKKRSDIKAVLHTHPLNATTIYSAGLKLRPITLEFALYIGDAITTVEFLPPGTEELAAAVSRTIIDHDAVLIKKHGLVTVGKSPQEAYLKALIIERESRAQFICRLFRRPPPFLTRDELSSLVAV